MKYLHSNLSLYYFKKSVLPLLHFLFCFISCIGIQLSSVVYSQNCLSLWSNWRTFHSHQRSLCALVTTPYPHLHKAQQPLIYFCLSWVFQTFCKIGIKEFVVFWDFLLSLSIMLSRSTHIWRMHHFILFFSLCDLFAWLNIFHFMVISHFDCSFIS